MVRSHCWCWKWVGRQWGIEFRVRPEKAEEWDLKKGRTQRSGGKEGAKVSLASLQLFLLGLPRSPYPSPARNLWKTWILCLPLMTLCTTSLSWKRPGCKTWLWSGSGNFQSLNLRFLVRFNGKEKHQQWLFLLVDPDISSDPIAWLSCRPHNDPPIPTSPETLKSDLGSNPSSVAYSL